MWCRRLRPTNMMKEKLRCLRRLFEINHEQMQAAYALLISFAITLAEFVFITSLVGCLKMHQSPRSMLGVGIGATYIMIVLKKSTKGAASLLETSKMSWEPQKMWMPQREQRIVREGRPFGLRIGNALAIGKETFPKIINDVIITSVVNLLIYFNEMESLH